MLVMFEGRQGDQYDWRKSGRGARGVDDELAEARSCVVF